MSHNAFPIPKRYTSPEAEAAFEKCSQQARVFRRSWRGDSGAALLGPTGTGKTTAIALACAAIKSSKQLSETWFRWVRADYLTRLVNERMGAEQIHDLKNSKVLVIDEMGYEPWPTALLEVIGDRHDNNRPTVITSGLTLNAFADRYSDATLRRIIEVNDGIVVDCWMIK